MIGKLKGIIDTIDQKHILLDVSGVCYRVFMSGYSLQQLSSEGEAAELLIETHVREDHIHLYGFVSEEEKQWFSVLTTVKGVGTKMVMAFFTALSPSELSLALASQDTAVLTQVSGVGKKLAERVVTELKDKVGTLASGSSVSSSIVLAGGGTSSDIVITDAVSALTNLGYGRADAFKMVTTLVAKEPDLSVEELIRKSLKEI